jgi:hypothetical protein
MTAPRQQRTVQHMTDRCGVKPVVTRVRPSSSELVTITGSREPSGRPWVATSPDVKKRNPSRKTRDGQRPRSSQGSARGRRAATPTSRKRNKHVKAATSS